MLCLTECVSTETWSGHSRKTEHAHRPGIRWQFQMYRMQCSWTTDIPKMINRTHICILTSAHPADDVRVANKMASSFSEKGYKVTWVGPNRIFFDRNAYERYKIHYSLFPWKKGKLGRLLSLYDTFKSGLKVRDVNVYYCPEPDSAAVGLWLARRNKAKVIFDIHEVYHGALLNKFVGKNLANCTQSILKRQIGRICRGSSLVIGVSESVLAPFAEQLRDKMVIRSCAPEWFAGSEHMKERGRGSPCLTIMHGKSHRLRGTSIVLKAMAIAKRHIPSLRVVMIDSFAGNRQEQERREFLQEVTELGVEDVVDFRPNVPMQQMPEMLMECNAGLIAYGRGLGEDSLPNRIFEYMASGLAIIAPAYAREMATIIKNEKCGLLVDFEDPKAIADAAISLDQNAGLCEEMRQRAREAFLRRHNWQSEVRPLLDKIDLWQSANPVCSPDGVATCL